MPSHGYLKRIEKVETQKLFTPSPLKTTKMKKQISTVFRLILISAIIAIVGCKRDSNGKPAQESKTQEIDYEAELNKIEDSVLQADGAVIQLDIKDADALFNSDDPSYIEEGNPNLQYIGMTSRGRPGDGAETNDTTDAKKFISNVYVGKTTVWTIITPGHGDYIFAFQEVDPAEGELSTDKDTQPCDAFVLKRATPSMPDNRRAITAMVKNDASLIDCKQPYTIIFSIENREGETRSFTLDPWIIVR